MCREGTEEIRQQPRLARFRTELQCNEGVYPADPVDEISPRKFRHQQARTLRDPASIHLPRVQESHLSRSEPQGAATLSEYCLAFRLSNENQLVGIGFDVLPAVRHGQR